MMCHRVSRLLRRDIGLHKDRIGAVLTKFRRAGKSGGGIDVSDRNPRAFRSQALGIGQAQSMARARDDDDLVLISRHRDDRASVSGLPSGYCGSWGFPAPASEKCDLYAAVVPHAAPNPGRNPDEIPGTECAFDLAIAVGPDAREAAFEDEEEFFNVRVQVERPLIPGRNHHRAEREMSGLNNTRVVVLAGSAAADISHLSPAVFGIDFGLKIEHTPIRASIFQTRDVFVDFIDRGK
jgi:hypothetical protein